MSVVVVLVMMMKKKLQPLLKSSLKQKFEASMRNTKIHFAIFI